MVQEWSPVREILSACVRNFHEKKKHWTRALRPQCLQNTEFLLEGLFMLLLGVADKNAFTSAVIHMPLWKKNMFLPHVACSLFL